MTGRIIGQRNGAARYRQRHLLFLSLGQNAFGAAPAGINGVVFAAKLDHFIGAHPHIIALAAGELG